MTTTTTRRGGARPRAGAPKGNLNALATGARSRRFAPVYRAVGPEGARIVIRAITQATDDALDACPQDDTRSAAHIRSRARAYAMTRVLTCAATITTDLIHAHGLHPALLHAFAPIWRGTDAVPPWLPAAPGTAPDQHTIKPAATTPALTRHTPEGHPIEVPDTPPTVATYLDSAASTPLRPEALAAMRPYFDALSANPSGHYASARRAADAIARAHEQVAQVLGAIPEEIVICSGGTESINAAIKGVAFAQREAGVGAHIVTTAVEHHAVIESARYLERFGFEVDLVPVDAHGRVDPAEVIAALRDDTVLVSVMYANNEVGTVQPIAEIGRLLRERARAGGRRIPFHTDAVQAANALTLDVDTLGVDLLSLSAHKFGGPQGAGVLYIRRGTPYLELLSGGGQERQRRSGTEDVPAAVGLATALTLAAAERDAFTRTTERLRARLLDGIRAALPEAQINGHPIERLPNLLHLCIDGVEGEAIVEALDAEGFETSAGAACTSATWEPSHVLLAMDVPLELAIGSLRLSLWPTHTEADIDRLVAALPAAVERARLASLPAI